MIEAGTGLDAAMNELIRRWRNTLTDEFALLLIDFQIGKPRREAWRELAARTQLPELNSFVGAMLQSEQTGAGIGASCVPRPSRCASAAASAPRRRRGWRR